MARSAIWLLPEEAVAAPRIGSFPRRRLVAGPGILYEFRSLILAEQHSPSVPLHLIGFAWHGVDPCSAEHMSVAIFLVKDPTFQMSFPRLRMFLHHGKFHGSPNPVARSPFVKVVDLDLWMWSSWP